MQKVSACVTQRHLENLAKTEPDVIRISISPPEIRFASSVMLEGRRSKSWNMKMLKIHTLL